MFVLACMRAEDGAMDNLPTVIMEAMGAALPVVSTNVAAVSGDDRGQGNRIHRSSGDSVALAQKMAYLLDNPKLPVRWACGDGNGAASCSIRIKLLMRFAKF